MVFIEKGIFNVQKVIAISALYALYVCTCVQLRNAYVFNNVPKVIAIVANLQQSKT